MSRYHATTLYKTAVELKGKYLSSINQTGRRYQGRIWDINIAPVYSVAAFLCDLKDSSHLADSPLIWNWSFWRVAYLTAFELDEVSRTKVHGRSQHREGARHVLLGDTPTLLEALPGLTGKPKAALARTPSPNSEERLYLPNPQYIVTQGRIV